jgi:hypothetical protein
VKAFCEAWSMRWWWQCSSSPYAVEGETLKLTSTPGKDIKTLQWLKVLLCRVLLFILMWCLLGELALPFAFPLKPHTNYQTHSSCAM